MRRRPPRPWVVALLLAALLATGGCVLGNLAPSNPPNAPQPDDVDRLHVLILNGGGRPAINYQSHLLHVEQLLSLLDQAGVPPERISIFSSDGDDPAADLAVRRPAEHPELWRVQGTPLQSSLRPLRYVSTAIDGFALRPASHAALAEWFASQGERLRPGDTLLLYVTDHGEKNPDDIDDNTITLWGEHLSVSQLRDLIATLHPEVRVVALMSQCFSGSFYGITRARLDDETQLPTGSVCGYYASTAARPAYGCYPESRGRDNLGHSFHFFQGLADSGGFVDAHLSTLVTDATPDVPLRSSDLFLREQLRAAAAARDVSLRTLVDELLAEAWKDRARWEPQIRLLDRIGEAFGFFSPRNLADVESQRSQVPAISRHLRSVSRAWRATLADANRAQLARFLDTEPRWRESADGEALRDLPDDELAVLAAEILDAVAAFTARDAEADARLRELHTRGSEAAAASFRMEVRHAAVLRMRMALIQVAGEFYLERHGSPDQRATHAALRACEDLRLPRDLQLDALAAPESFPALSEDIARATAALPAWIGIRFGSAEEDARRAHGLAPGAARVLTVFPDSPAEAAGLAAGDILVGPPGEPFFEDRAVRWWTMLGEPGAPRRLEVIRAGNPMVVDIVPGTFPLEWPSLPGPPAPGDAAPPLRLSAYRGDADALREGPHILYFWATWCAPCRAALPDLLAFAAARGLPIIAVTDEPRERLDAYFATSDPFAEVIAIDAYRQTFQAYGVSGTPTFIWVEGGRVRAFAAGYSAAAGIGLDPAP